MKKNLLSIIILFLLIVNISLTSVMMFSLVLPNQRALALMTDVATVLRLELPAAGIGGDYVAPEVAIANVKSYMVAAGEAMMIPLRQGPGEERTRYIMVRASLSMDSKNKGFKSNNEGDLSEVDMMIQNIINRIFGNYTMDDVQDPAVVDMIQKEIILELHALYDSDFIFAVQFTDVKYA